MHAPRCRVQLHFHLHTGAVSGAPCDVCFQPPKNTSPPPPPTIPVQVCGWSTMLRIKHASERLLRVDLHIGLRPGTSAGCGRSTCRDGGGPRGSRPPSLLRFVAVNRLLILCDRVVAQRVRRRLVRLTYVGVLDLDKRPDQIQRRSLIPPVSRLQTSARMIANPCEETPTSQTSVRLAGSWMYRAIKGSVISHS